MLNNYFKHAKLLAAIHKLCAKIVIPPRTSLLVRLYKYKSQLLELVAAKTTFYPGLIFEMPVVNLRIATGKCPNYSMKD